MADFAALTLSVDSTGIKQSINELDRLGAAGDKVERDISKSTGVIGSSFESLKTAALGLASAYGAISAVRGLTDAAVDIQKFENTLVAATGSAGEAAKEMEFVRKVSNDLGLDLRSTAEQYSKLAAAARDTKLEGKDTRDIFVGIAQAATALGSRADETAGALNAIQQIISKNVVSMEELRGQLGERLPGAMRIAQQAMGLTSEEFNKLVGSGSLTADVLLPRMAEQFQKTFGQASQSAAQGLSGQINRFNNALFDLQVAIGRTGIIEFFTSATQSAAGFVARSAEIVRLYSNDIKIAFAAVIDVGRGVINTFHAAALGVASIIEQVKALLQLDFKKAISINPIDIIKKPFEESLTKTFDETVKNIANKPISLPEAKIPLAIDVKIPAALSGAVKQAASKSKEISESERFIQSLKKEAEEANKTEIELLQLRASKLGVADAAAPLISLIEKNTLAFNAQKDAANNLANDLLDVERITESVLTAEEKLSREQERLNKLLNLPNNAGLSLETYNRALRKAQDEFVKLSTTGKKSFEDVSQFAIQAERNIQTAFGDALRLGFEGNLGGMVSSFKSALASMVAQAISADLLGKLFGRGTGQVSALLDSFKSIFTGGGTASIALDTSSLTGGIAKLGDVFKSSISGLSGIFSKMPKGAFTGATFLGGPGTALANGAGGAATGGLLSGAAGILGAGAVGAGIGTFIGGDKKLFGLGSGTTSTLGAALGAIGGPLGAALGGVVGGALNALFGRGPLKQKETNLIGSATESGFSGITSTKLKAEGGLLVGDKVIRIEADADTGKLLKEFNGKLKETAQAASEAAVLVGRFVDEGIQGISKGLKESAQALGINVDVLKDFSQSINIASEKGKALTEEQLGKVVSDFGDAMARKLLPEIDNLTKGGETAAQAFARLGGEFQLLVDVLEVMGKSTAQASEFLKGVSFESRDAFLKLAGGADKLSQNLAGFSDNFLTIEERIKPVQEMVNKTFNDLGISGINTNEQFKQLVLSQDLTTEAGQRMFSALLDIQDEFATVTSAFGELGGSVEKVTEQINKATEAQQRAATRRAEIEARERRQEAQKKVLDDLAKVRAEETQNAIELRDSLLRAGDAIKLLNNELIIKRPEINKDADFATEFARVQADIAGELISAISDNALVINDAVGAIRQLGRVVTSGPREESAFKEIKGAISQGIDDSRINQALNGLAKTMAGLQVGRDLNRFGQGIAGVLSGFSRLSLAQASGTVGGKEVRGADVIAYAKVIDSLNKDLNDGKIKADQYNKAVDNVNKRFGDLGKLLASPVEQLERIRREGRNLAGKGFESIQFYFKQISEQAKELDAKAKELDTPMGNVVEAIGRFKSISDVFGISVKAIAKGLKAAGESFDAINKAGSSVSKASIIARGASIAQSVINTETGRLIQERIKNDPLFKRNDAKQIRDISLLLGEIQQFDTESLENSFLRINNALAKGQINEAQYAKLFNTALDTFEGLESGINGATSSLGQLKKAAREAADNILLDKKLTVLNPQQQFKVAERQFLDVVNRAKGGDASASGQLETAAKTLLEAGFISRDNQTDLFTFVQAKLREVEGVGGLQRLEVDQKILNQLESMNKRLDDQQKINQQITAQVMSVNLRATDTLERWEKIGMPATRA